jgi:transcriptional regulator with XRE-family HTH domain
VAKHRSQLGQQLGARIAALRAERGMTQEALAWQAGLASKGYLSRIESGERLPSLAVLERLAAQLDLEVRDLLIFPERSRIDRAMERVRRRG